MDRLITKQPMPRAVFALLCLANVMLLHSTATTVRAQGGMGGGMGGPPGGMGGRGMAPMPRGGAMPKFATAKELEAFNAAEALLRDKKSLKLTDAQLDSLSALRARLFERNADLIARYDSVRRDFKPPRPPEGMSGPPGGGMGGPPGGGMGGPPGGGMGGPPAGGGAAPDDKKMAVTMQAMKVMAEIGDALVERRPADVASCLALVTDEQRDRATKVLDAQTASLRKAVPKLASPDGGRELDRR